MMQISPDKDVDGFNPLNMGKMLMVARDSCRAHQKALLWHFRCSISTHRVKRSLLSAQQRRWETGCYHVVESERYGQDMHVFTKDLKIHTKEADILIVATGVRGLIKGDMVKEGAWYLMLV